MPGHRDKGCTPGIISKKFYRLLVKKSSEFFYIIICLNDRFN